MSADHAAAGDLGIEARHQHRAGERDEAGQPGFGVAGVGRQQRGAQAAGERQSEDQDQRHGVPRVSGPLPPAPGSERRNRPGIERQRRTEPWPGASLHYALPAGTTPAPLNGDGRNKRNSFLEDRPRISSEKYQILVSYAEIYARSGPMTARSLRNHCAFRPCENPERRSRAPILTPRQTGTPRLDLPRLPRLNGPVTRSQRNAARYGGGQRRPSPSEDKRYGEDS